MVNRRRFLGLLSVIPFVKNWTPKKEETYGFGLYDVEGAAMIDMSNFRMGQRQWIRTKDGMLTEWYPMSWDGGKTWNEPK